MKNRLPYFHDILILLLLFTLGVVAVFISFKIFQNSDQLFSLSYLTLMIGLLYESFRITKNWKTLLYILLGSYILSFFFLLPGKREIDYNFHNRLLSLPYAFTCTFCFIIAITYEKVTTIKLTEGITLLQSMAFLYWTIDTNIWSASNIFIKALVVISIILSVFSIFNSLTYFILSKTIRLLLSIWSSSIMLVFSAENIFRIYRNETIIKSTFTFSTIGELLQYFLLGISAIYFTQNLILLLRFLPGKGYFSDLEELKKAHIDRYSDLQVHFIDSLICILLSSLYYYLNYKKQFFTIHTAIWVWFIMFPIIINLKSVAFSWLKKI
ncbi:hypothetical protein [Lacihabitans lacunae]|uniref:Uncharacterized protein n=1 Tax=Lacihabitans lacunae TaxID=1028214 RepID=A0ABV7YUE8_9BACT